MSNSIPITKPINPKFIIQHIVASSVFKLYGIKWHPRVVLQKNRKVEGSSLSSVDYAVPCFELCKEVGKSAVEISKQIAYKFHERVTVASDDDYLKSISSEYISGYVNFCLERSLVEDIIKKSLLWYAEPSPLVMNKNLFIHILGFTEDTPSYVFDSVYLVQELGSLVGVDVAASYLHQNTSNSYIEKLIERYAKKDTVQKIMLKKTVRDIIANSESVEESIASVLNTETGNPRLSERTLFKLKNSRIISEQALVPEVQEFLTTNLPALVNGSNNYIFDKDNKAIYFELENNVVALRSAEGFLYDHAYILYYLNCLKVSKQRLGRTIFFAPYSAHSVINIWLSLIFDDLEPFVLFDPSVSKLDIEEITSTTASTSILLGEARSYLNDFNDVEVDSSDDRHGLLQLTDFTIDTLLALENRNLPSFFDLINNVTSVIHLES